jgi:hypothetical protein
MELIFSQAIRRTKRVAQRLEVTIPGVNVLQTLDLLVLGKPAARNLTPFQPATRELLSDKVPF